MSDAGSDPGDAGGDVPRLVVYGTLRPGRANHHLVADLGPCEPVQIVGRMGTWHGYPAFTPDAGGHAIDADLVSSERLAERWDELDRFEGPGYRRVILRVETNRGWCDAQCYIAVDDGSR